MQDLNVPWRWTFSDLAELLESDMGHHTERIIIKWI